MIMERDYVRSKSYP